VEGASGRVDSYENLPLKFLLLLLIKEKAKKVVIL